MWRFRDFMYQGSNTYEWEWVVTQFYEITPIAVTIVHVLSATFSSIAGAEKVVGWALSHHLMQNLEADPDSRVLLSSERLPILSSCFPFGCTSLCYICPSNCSCNSVLQFLQYSIRDQHLTGYPEWI